MSTVRFYDPDTKAITELPISELAPGCIAVQQEGIEGTVFVESSKLKISSELRHPPFEAEYQTLFDDFAEYFKDVYPRTALEWADGFRRDTHPEKEIEIWCSIAGAFNFFTKGKSMSLAHKRDYFRLVLLFFTNGERATMETVQLQALSPKRAKSVVQRLKQGNP